MRTEWESSPVLIAGVAAAYVLAGKLGLLLVFVQANATAMWPTTGIALAAFLSLGYRVWPGIFLGAFLVYFSTTGSLATTLGIALGNTLEGLAGAYLVNRFAHRAHAFDRPPDVLKFAALPALVGTTVGPLLGVTSLALGGYADWAAYWRTWLTWWLGDVGGALIVAPALLLWSQNLRVRWTPAQVKEAGLMLVTLIPLFWRWVAGSHLPAQINTDSMFISLIVSGIVGVGFGLAHRLRDLCVCRRPAGDVPDLVLGDLIPRRRRAQFLHEGQEVFAPDRVGHRFARVVVDRRDEAPVAVARVGPHVHVVDEHAAVAPGERFLES